MEGGPGKIYFYLTIMRACAERQRELMLFHCLSALPQRISGATPCTLERLPYPGHRRLMGLQESVSYGLWSSQT